MTSEVVLSLRDFRVTFPTLFGDVQAVSASAAAAMPSVKVRIESLPPLALPRSGVRVGDGASPSQPADPRAPLEWG